MFEVGGVHWLRTGELAVQSRAELGDPLVAVALRAAPRTLPLPSPTANNLVLPLLFPLLPAT